MEAYVNICILSSHDRIEWRSLILNTATYEFKIITHIGGTGRPRSNDCDVQPTVKKTV